MLKFLRAFAFLLPLFVAIPALSADGAYDAARFDALAREGKTVLVSIHADWCPTCRAQAPIVSELLKMPEFSGVMPLRVDFDGQKDVVKRFKATSQSTLIVFKGGKEVGRSVGDTGQAGIAALLRKGV